MCECRGRAVARIAAGSNRTPACINTRDLQPRSRVLVVAALRQCGYVAPYKCPAHARHLSGTAMDHELDGAAGTFAPGEIDALLELDRIFIGAEAPNLAVGQHQHRAV